MDFGMEASIFLAYTAGMLAIYFLGRFLIVPLKILVKLMINSIIGGIIMLIINFIGGGLGVFLPINIITALISGALGVPGILGLLIYFNLIV